MRIFIGLLLIALLCAPTWAQQPAWTPTGTVSVKGKIVPNAHFLKSGRNYLFPVLAVATGMGKKASFDAAAKKVTWEGQDSSPTSLMVVDGVPYISWKDLVKLEPSLDYGVSSEQVVFFVRPEAAHIDLPTDYEKLPYMVVNEKNPGQIIPKLVTFAVKGKYTVFEFFSEYCPPCRAWAPILQAIALRNSDVRVRRFDINRPGSQGIDFESPLARQGKFQSVPAWYILDPDGKQTKDDEAFQQVYRWALGAGYSEGQLRSAGAIR